MNILLESNEVAIIPKWNLRTDEFKNQDVLQELSKEVASRVSTMESVLCFFSDFFGGSEAKDFEAALEPMIGCLDSSKNCILSKDHHNQRSKI